MKVSHIKKSLQELKRTFRRLLDDSASVLIDEAIGNLEISKKKFDQWQGQTHAPGKGPEFWGYSISPDRPLRFIPSKAIKGQHVWVDLFCEVS